MIIQKSFEYADLILNVMFSFGKKYVFSLIIIHYCVHKTVIKYTNMFAIYINIYSILSNFVFKHKIANNFVFLLWMNYVSLSTIQQ